MKSSTTGYSPAKLMLGASLRLPTYPLVEFDSCLHTQELEVAALAGIRKGRIRKSEHSNKIMKFKKEEKVLELQQTKSVAARNRTSDLPDSGRPDEPKGYNVKLFYFIVRSIHTHDSWDNKQCRAAYAHYCSIADEKSRLPILCINSICRAPNSLRRDQSGKNEKKKPRFHCGKCGKHISIADYYTMIMGLTTFESDSQNTSTSGDNEHPKDMRSTDIHHYIESSSINVSPDLRKESIEYDGFNLDFEDNPVVHISSKPIKPSSTVFSGIGSATPSTSEYQQSKKQKTSFAVPSKETSFFLLSKKLAKGKNNTEPLQIENALRSLT
ncbi:hypothetical protein BB560_006736, partial [Smittium megazygosporum]